MAISLEAYPTLPRGYIQIDATTAAIVAASGVGPATLDLRPSTQL